MSKRYTNVDPSEPNPEGHGSYSLSNAKGKIELDSPVFNIAAENPTFNIMESAKEDDRIAGKCEVPGHPDVPHIHGGDFIFEEAIDEDNGKPPMTVEGPPPPQPHRYIVTAEIQFDVGARNVIQAYKIFTDWIAGEFNAQHSLAEVAAGKRSARPTIAPCYYEGLSIAKTEEGTPSRGRQ